MTPPPVDPARFKDEQRSNWDGVSAGWARGAEIFERGGAVVTGRLLELAGVRAGQSVLDVGTGAGEPALTAARRVGPAGQVTGIDLAPAMVEIARARAAGLAQAQFLVGDADTLDLAPATFDAVLSRWGLMFVIDQEATFAGLRRLLRPGGVLAAAVWGPPASVPMLSAGFAALAQRLDLPAPPHGTPGPFSMSDPAQLTTAITAGGFAEVSVTEFAVPFWLGHAGEYADFNRSVAPPAVLAMIRERYGSADDPPTWQAVADAVAPYAASDGTFELTSAALLVRAVA